MQTIRRVASRAGARIETTGSGIARRCCCRLPRGGADRNCRRLLASIAPSWSPPARGRGSKLSAVWIHFLAQGVASRAGARIETQVKDVNLANNGCRLPRGGADRNLHYSRRHLHDCRRLPRGGADRNSRSVEVRKASRVSPPARGRGSKHFPMPGCKRSGGRLPRGGADRNNLISSSAVPLKSRLPRGGADRNWHGGHRPRDARVASRAGARIETNMPTVAVSAWLVASRAGARIETGQSACLRRILLSPPARGRGSKPTNILGIVGTASRRLPRGGADRNVLIVLALLPSVVASRAGARIETSFFAATASRARVASRAGARIETASSGRFFATLESPPARGRGSKRLHGSRAALPGASPPARGRGSKHFAGS